jgi:hypothetical protein
MTKEKFVVSNWYRIKEYTTDYRKCSDAKEKNGYMFYSDSIQNNIYVNERGLCGSKYNRLQPIDLSEIQDYLPFGHPDKFSIIIPSNQNKHIIKLLNKLGLK